ncbi:MAG: inositol monophosphatase family protein [Verrucomicrobiales bacterium]|nr:inositol monophosphatase family protein [Verrucomicrobiales bacterium]
MKEYLDVGVAAAKEAGALLMEHYGKAKNVDEFTNHDIKLELDVKSQDLITERLLAAFPDHAIYGEEGIAGDQSSEWHWIVDPIDGTVNYFYGIPHFCVSIALRRGEEMVVGVIYDPCRDELFSAVRGGGAFLNGEKIGVSERATMREAVVTVGFSKTKASLDAGFLRFQKIAYEVRKTRMMGSAALAMAYITCGRLDAYIEEQISLWDIAAGWIMLEEAGGVVELGPSVNPGDDKFFICASNGKLPIQEYV